MFNIHLKLDFIGNFLVYHHTPAIYIAPNLLLALTKEYHVTSCPKQTKHLE